MAQPLSSNTQGLALGGILLALVVAGSLYVEFVASKATVPTVQHASFSTAVITGDMKAGGVFDQTVGLSAPSAAAATPTATVTAGSGDFGKSDITKYE